jgi:predicted methyltransferase
VKQPVAFFATAAAAVLLAYATPALTQQAANIAGAIADTNRPQTDKDLDAQRKPAEMLTFAGLKPGDKVLEFVPGRGYVTRLLAKAVGATGHVYIANLPTFNEALKTGVDAIIASPTYGNVRRSNSRSARFGLPSRWMWRGFRRTTTISRTWVNFPPTPTPWTEPSSRPSNPGARI